MKLKISIVFIFFFYCSNSFTANIRVIDLQRAIDSSKDLLSLYNQIENDQKKYTLEFKNIESQLQIELKKIDQLALILDDKELEKEVNLYNDKLNKFNTDIEQFNIHYEKQITNLKNIIINNILNILKMYSSDNQIDLILDSNHYILSSNSINITDMVIEEINKQNIGYSFKKYE